MPHDWHNEPAVIVVLRKLQELALRAARLELAHKARRTQAMLAALEPNLHARRSPSQGTK